MTNSLITLSIREIGFVPCDLIFRATGPAFSRWQIIYLEGTEDEELVTERDTEAEAYAEAQRIEDEQRGTWHGLSYADAQAHNA